MTLSAGRTRTDDVLAIQRATHLYARGLDRFDPREALSAFTDDAVWDATPVGLERFEGREEILGFFERDAAAIADQFHIITNHVVDVDDDGETARGTNYVFSEGHTNSGAAFKAIALNEDTYRRTRTGGGSPPAGSPRSPRPRWRASMPDRTPPTGRTPA